MNKLSAMLANTLVKNTAGEPLVVYRGERHNPDTSKFHSRLPSLSFAGLEAASQYSIRDWDVATKSHIHEVFLNIQNPVFNSEDPFIEYPEIEAVVGKELATALVIRHSDHVMNTGNWNEHLDPGMAYRNVAELLAAQPEKIEDIYLDIYPILDDVEFVHTAQKAGYDGAIYIGTGANMQESEYRIFDASQAYCAKTGRCYGVAPRRERTPEAEGLSI
jgi:hypothetical protein